MNSTAEDIYLNKNDSTKDCFYKRNALSTTKKPLNKDADKPLSLMPLRRLIDFQKEIEEAANEPLTTFPVVVEDENEDEHNSSYPELDLNVSCEAFNDESKVATNDIEKNNEVKLEGFNEIHNITPIEEQKFVCHKSALESVIDNKRDEFAKTLCNDPSIKQTNSTPLCAYKPILTPSTNYSNYKPIEQRNSISYNNVNTSMPKRWPEENTENIMSDEQLCRSTTTPSDIFRPIMRSVPLNSMNYRKLEVNNFKPIIKKPTNLHLDCKNLPYEEGIQPIKNTDKPFQILTNKLNTPLNYAKPYGRNLPVNCLKTDQISTPKIVVTDSDIIKPKVQCSISIKDLLQTPANKPSSKNKFTTPLNTRLQLPHVYSRKTPKTVESNKNTGKESSHQKVIFSLPLSNPIENNVKNICVKNVKYLVLNQLGKGGSSVVYHCYNVSTNEHRAIKCISLRDQNSATSFLNEVKMLEKLQNCDHIIKMYDYEIVESDNLLLVVLEKGGPDLSKIIKKLFKSSKRLTLDRLMHYWMELLRAVKQIHENGIVHSDLKPANFLWTEDGIKLIDFGIASCLQNDMTTVVKNVQEGTFDYISPEALSNGDNLDGEKPKFKISYASDVWSLGCILYQFVYKRPPFGHIGHMWAKLGAIINRQNIEYPEDDWAPKKFINTIRSCLQYDMKARPSVDSLIEEYKNVFY